MLPSQRQLRRPDRQLPGRRGRGMRGLVEAGVVRVRWQHPTEYS